MKYNFDKLNIEKENCIRNIKMKSKAEIENTSDLQIDVTLQKSNYRDLTKHVVLISGRTRKGIGTVLLNPNLECVMGTRKHTGRIREVLGKV